MRAQEVHALTRPFAGNGDGFAARSARLAVSRSGELEEYVRPAVPHAADMAGMVAPRLFGAKANVHRGACGAQARVPGTGNFGIGIFQCRDDARDARGDDGVGAGRRFAVMRARLERDVKRRPASGRACASQSFDLGMRPPAGLCPAAADDHPILDDHRADRRIGPRASQAPPAQRQRKRHVASVDGRLRVSLRCKSYTHRSGAWRLRVHLRAGAANSAASSDDNSASAVSKSLASRKLR
jgi:hypothetical protein